MTAPPTCPECGREEPVRETTMGGLWLCHVGRGGCGHMWREPEPEPIRRGRCDRCRHFKRGGDYGDNDDGYCKKRNGTVNPTDLSCKHFEPASGCDVCGAKLTSFNDAENPGWFCGPCTYGLDPVTLKPKPEPDVAAQARRYRDAEGML